MATKKPAQPSKDPKEEKKPVSTLTADLMHSVKPVALESEMRESYLSYAMSVIVSRALPDVRDGLKPVHRRCLYATYQLGMTYDKPYKKSATAVGEVLGKYHPHGDQAVYDTIVRLAQNFSMRYPLMDGQGNFGSIDGDPAAAMRYTEVRMAKLSDELLKDIEKETVNFTPNFDDSRKEPSVFPSAYPNLLVNGSVGIAIGMATNMAPHNLREVTNAVCAYIDNPKIDLSELMKHIPGPDFPTGGIIYGLDGIKSAYTKGRGAVKVRAKIDVEIDKRGREAFIITEIPYMLKKADCIVKIADLVKQGKIEGIATLRDESDRRGMRIYIELKKNVDSQIVLNQLFKHTPLESTFGIINLALVNGEPKVLTLKQLIELFVKHRVEVVTRRTEFDLKQAEARAHILEGLIIAQAHIDEVIKLIRASKNTEEARTKLMTKFKLTEVQAQAILDMPLRRLTALEREKLETEHAELQKLIAYYTDLLAHPKKLLGVIKKELIDIAERFGDNRRSEIVGKVDTIAIDSEDLIHDEDVVVTLTDQGFIKRVLAASYRAQSRGGVGVSSGKTKNEDFVRHMVVASTKDALFFMTDKGKAFWLKVHEIPAMAKTAQGRGIKFILNLAPNEHITSYFTVRDIEEADQYVVMITKNGTLKKMSVAQLANAKKRGILALKLEDGDELVDVNVLHPGDDFIMTTKNGLALRVSEERIRPQGRAAAGVRGMRLDPEDSCVSCTAIKKGEALIVITERGIGKRLSPKRFNVKGRGGKGQIYMTLDQKTGAVVRVRAVGDTDDVMIVTNEDMLIKVHASEISEMGRNARGVKIVNIKDPAHVMDLAIVPANMGEEKK